MGVATYAVLRRQVEETLLLGQRKIEQAKVETYWRTGQLIHEHILHHDSRREHYGKQVIERLAKELDVSDSVLWRCLRFARSFKILAARQESFVNSPSWTHFRELIKVPDEKDRIEFMQRAQKTDWTSRELVQKGKGAAVPFFANSKHSNMTLTAIFLLAFA